MSRINRQSGIALLQLLLVAVALTLAAAVVYLIFGQQRLPVPVLQLSELAVSEAPSSLTMEPSQSPSPSAVNAVGAGSIPSTKLIAAPVSKSSAPPLSDREKTLVALPPRLPSLNESDQEFRQALLGLTSSALLANWLIDEELIRKLVVTIDNMADGKLVHKHSLFKPMADKFRASKQAERIWLDGYNFSRYKHYLQVFETIDINLWVALYQRYYPLMQQAYAELGYPRQAFHDRVLQALELLLASPVIPKALPLTQPSVRYIFADQQLEQLPAVHKQLLRVGSVHSSRLLDRLTLLRVELVKLQGYESG